MLGAPGAKLQLRNAKEAPLPAPTHSGAPARPVSLGNHMYTHYHLPTGMTDRARHVSVSARGADVITARTLARGSTYQFTSLAFFVVRTFQVYYLSNSQKL